MKTLFIILSVSCFTQYCSAQFISDKGELHVLAGAAISGATYTIVYSKTKNKSKAFWYSLGASTLAGVLKEVYDTTVLPKGFDEKDALATAVGGLAVSATFNLFTGNKKKKRKRQAMIYN